MLVYQIWVCVSHRHRIVLHILTPPIRQGHVTYSDQWAYSSMLSIITNSRPSWAPLLSLSLLLSCVSGVYVRVVSVYLLVQVCMQMHVYAHA